MFSYEVADGLATLALLALLRAAKTLCKVTNYLPNGIGFSLFFFKELRIKPKIDHLISILVSVCSEQVAAGAPKAMAGYGETRREAKVWAMQSPQT